MSDDRAIASAIYSGSVRHRRLTPVAHCFRSPLFMMYLDLAELPALFDRTPLWSARRAAPAWFRRRDYLGDPATPLDQAVRELVTARLGVRPEGPIRLLTQLRYFGYVQNPVSFYYCFDAAAEQLVAVIADVTNTPWGDRHAYVMAATERSDHGTVQMLHERMDKELHVSPFMGMDHDYDWRVTEPGGRLSVHIESRREGALVFDATLSLRRREISAASLTGALARYPFMTARIAARIYAHALRLKLKGAPYFRRPSRGQAWSA